MALIHSQNSARADQPEEYHIALVVASCTFVSAINASSVYSIFVV